MLDTRTRVQYAVKFCLNIAAFHTEAALYAAAFPHVRKLLSASSHNFGSPTATAGLCTHPWGSGGSACSFTGLEASDKSSGDASLSPLSALMRSAPGPPANIGERRALLVPAKPCMHGQGYRGKDGLCSRGDGGQGWVGAAGDPGMEIRPASPVDTVPAAGEEGMGAFLPALEMVCESAAAGLVDPRGRLLPPCIIMERGESLAEWVRKQEADLFRALTVRPSRISFLRLRARTR